jgi:hypothetical protein
VSYRKFLFLALLLIPASIWARPRIPNPTTPSDIYTNDLDNYDALQRRVNKSSNSWCIGVSSVCVEELSNNISTVSYISFDDNTTITTGKGMLLQVVSSVTVTSSSTISTSYHNTDHVATMVVSSGTNIVWVNVTGTIYADTANKVAYVTVKRDSTNLGHADRGVQFGMVHDSEAYFPIGFRLKDVPGAGSHTYTIQLKTESGARVYWNSVAASGVSSAWLTLEEISQ